MKKNIIGLNMKYRNIIPFFAFLLMLSLFLPYISIQGEQIRVSGFQIVQKAILMIMEEKLSLKLSLTVILVLLPPFLVCISSIFIFLIRNKSVVKASIITFIISALCAVIILFTVTKSINASGLMPVKFQIKYLGIGYWIFFIAGFSGIVVSMKAAKINSGYIILCIMSVVWLFPIAWIILISFRAAPGSYTSYFWPKEFTLKNYIVLLTDNSQFHYVRWFQNTLLVAICSCMLSTFIVLSTAFVLSRIRFQGRKPFMNILLILGMFPGFMSMIAVYYILKGMGLAQSLTALILVYSGGSALGYYIVKGFFDTIPKALDEAAHIDGATKWHIFTRITLPLSKPIIIYTILTSFMGPWADYIFARVIIGDDYKNYTVALGLYTMLERNNIDTWYTRFASGAVLVSIPIALLFIALQKYYVEGLSGSVKG
jgi:arabinogalactan oligomer/maltooligosaccharide transport system permease protein